MANKVLFGLKNVYYAKRIADDSSGEPQWETPVALPGAVTYKPTAEGDEVKFYADDGLFFSATQNNGYSADLEMATVTDEIVADMLNWPIDDNGALIEDADALPTPFALIFEVQGDAKARRTVLYECRAARPEPEEKTKGASIEPRTETLKLTIVPIEVGGITTPKATLELSESNTSEYEGFFTEVYVPVISDSV
jgi:phi13 family phage major tail protein